MTQTQKRLTIIEIAISITDIETINLQILQLQPLRSDIGIDRILSELEKENYAQAQKLIIQYHESPNHTVVQRIPIEELEIIDSFDFLEIKTSKETESDTTHTQNTEETIASKQSFDTLLNIDTKSVLSNNIQLDTETKKMQKEKIDFALDQIPNDTFLDTDSHNTNVSNISSVTSSEITKDSHEVHSNTTINLEENTNISSIDTKDKPVLDSYILLESLEKMYPPIIATDVYSPLLKTWLEAINKDDYDNYKIESMIKEIDALSQTNKSEAALLLLATSITKTTYAQFILARALYKGTILSRNLEESFRIMSQLTHKDHYPQAYCDLAQFYENGIATKKNKKEALNLYKEAMDLGIQRATKHYERLKKETSGFFSFFK